MRKLLAISLCAMFVLGDATIYSLQSAQAATYLQDERAEVVLRQARQALGGDAVINAIENILINGRVNHKIKLPDGQERAMDANVEMALETSGKLHRSLKSGGEVKLAAEPGKTVFFKEADVIVHKKLDGAEAEKIQRRVSNPHGEEFSRLLFGLLLKTSPGLKAIYNYVGEGSVDGTAADIVEATGENGFAVKLYIDKSSHLPLMMSYRSAKPFQIFLKKDGAASAGLAEKDVTFFRHTLPEGEKVNGNGEVKVFVRKKDENGTVTETVKAPEGLPRIAVEEADFQVRFSDYRSVNGLMLPHRIAKTVNGEEGETMTIDSYQVNVANLGEKFKDNFTFVRKPTQK
ncbi:MAG: hypothetical protein M3209_10190 [Acidobacteriota bacterium]|nr:hypothetical protein [Acidobacteriota bacterium]